MITPTPEQRDVLDAVLDADPGPLRISAGAGTGKTTTVALVVQDLVRHRDLAPEQILGITFTNKAAAELSDRIRGVIGPLVGPGREAEVHTYHGFAAQVVREFGALVGVERDAGVITPTYSRQLLFDVVQHRRFRHYDATWSGNLEKIQRLGAALGDHLVDVDDLVAASGDDEPWPERLELLEAWTDYRAEKSRLGVVDYADLISAAVRLLTHHPAVVDRIRGRYGAVLLDEYQDTNPAQRVMLQTLFGGGFPVVAVGDTDQTIYEWRGASPHNFERFPDHFPAPDGRPARALPLTVNRRSDRRILTVANVIRGQIGSATGDLTPLETAEQGSVGVRWATDAVAEADWIADRVARLHEEGLPWNEIAVLFRKNRHISLVHDALTEREIPVEVVNLGGLLSVPEVADVRAWMRIVHSPEDGPALLRLLMGPRFALGMGDLVHLTRWVAASSQDDVDLDHERLPRATMVEAIEHLDDIDGLPDRVRGALYRFAQEHRHLLEVAQGVTLAELTRTILDVTGVWSDVEAMGPAGRLSARLNLYRFLDLTEEWSPLEGRPSLAAFLAHLEAMEENPAEELDAARLSGEDAVALLTVHRAKGLEWDAVFVPGVVKGTFPSRSSGFEDPYRKSQFLPHRFRLDDPPPFGADTSEKAAKDLLRERHLRQEWRVAYVAVTRARHHLFVSGAHWFGTPVPNQRPVGPSELYDLVAGLDVTDDLGHDELADRPEVLRTADRQPAPDPLFQEGWGAAVRAALDDPAEVGRRAEALGVEEAVAESVADYQQRLFDVTDVPTVASEPERPAASVTGMVTYAACPRRHYWTDVDRLPRRPSPAARRGVEVHRRIELHARGAVPIDDLERQLYDVVEGGSDGAGAGAAPYASYLDSEYADRTPLMVEVPFQFDTGAGLAVRGRIDAVYPRDGGWEIVDFKSGRRKEDPWLDVQLQAYAVATERVDFGHPPPQRLDVSFVYLGDGAEVRRIHADDAWRRGARERVESIAAAIVDQAFDPIPSPACRSCDFVRFCAQGRRWLDEHQS